MDLRATFAVNDVISICIEPITQGLSKAPLTLHLRRLAGWLAGGSFAYEYGFGFFMR